MLGPKRTVVVAALLTLKLRAVTVPTVYRGSPERVETVIVCAPTPSGPMAIEAHVATPFDTATEAQTVEAPSSNLTVTPAPPTGEPTTPVKVATSTTGCP